MAKELGVTVRIARRLVLVALLTSMLVLLAACGGDGSTSPDGELNGTWSFSTTADEGSPFGAGTISLTYVGSFDFFFTFDLYAGSGSIGGVAYSIAATEAQGTNAIEVEISTDSDEDDDYVTFTGTRTGNTVSGTYAGEGTYAGRTGSFIMTR